MAYIAQVVSAGTDGVSAASIDFVDWLDQQQSGDYIVVIAANDLGTSAITGMSGWTQHYLSASAISGTRSGVWSQKNTGSTVTAPTISGANGPWSVVGLLIRDADGTTFADVASSTTEQTSNTTSPTCPSVTTSTSDALVLRICCGDGTANARALNPNDGVFVVCRPDRTDTATPAQGISVDYQVKFTAGATGTYVFCASANDGGTQTTLAIRNASGGKVPAVPTNAPLTCILALNDYPAAPTGTLLSALHASPATLLGYECALGDTTGGTIRNVLSAQDVSYLNRGMQGYKRHIGQQQTATTGLGSRTYGAAMSVTANLSTNFLVMQVVPGQTATQARLDNVGSAFYFRDNAGAYALWRPFTEIQGLSPRPVVAYLPNETMVETGGGTIDWANITYIGVAFPINATGGSANWETQFYFLGLLAQSGGVATPVSVCGGASAKPIDARDVASAVYNAQLAGLFSIQGAKQNLIGIPVQIGDGTNPTYFNGAAGATEYVGSSTLGMRPANGALPYRIKAKSTDSISLGAQAVGSSNAHKFVIDSASSTSATYDFGGTIFGMTPTLIDGITLTGTAFTSCGEIDAQTATLVNCTIKRTTSTDAAVAYDANGSMSGCTIDLTGTSAAYHIELGTAVTAFTLTNVTFTGTPGTDKVHVKKTTGTVTITLAGTTSLVAGDVTSDGATVSIVSGADVTLTGLVAGSEIRAYVGTPDSSTLIDSTEISSTSFTFNQSYSGQAGFIVVRKVDYKFLKISLTYSGSAQSIPVQQQADRDYRNP